jgi:hypothetical protein
MAAKILGFTVCQEFIFLSETSFYTGEKFTCLDGSATMSLSMDWVNDDYCDCIFLSEMSFYTGEKFTCLDGSATMTMDWVNDDYCDCRDGSDEPGDHYTLIQNIYLFLTGTDSNFCLGQIQDLGKERWHPSHFQITNFQIFFYK